jgi:hypothetical protein
MQLVKLESHERPMTHEDAQAFYFMGFGVLNTAQDRFSTDTAADRMARADDVDYRAMMAREVDKERCWRIYHRVIRPAQHALDDLAAYDGHATRNNRETVEWINGEPL